jgi:hypothetical protein
MWKTDAISKFNVLSCCTRGRIFNAGIVTQSRGHNPRMEWKMIQTG